MSRPAPKPLGHTTASPSSVLMVGVLSTDFKASVVEDEYKHALTLYPNISKKIQPYWSSQRFWSGELIHISSCDIINVIKTQSKAWLAQG